VQLLEHAQPHAAPAPRRAGAAVGAGALLAALVGEHVDYVGHLAPVGQSDVVEDEDDVAGLGRGRLEPVGGGAPGAHQPAAVATARRCVAGRH
jgi:hypothetical protein